MTKDEFTTAIIGKVIEIDSDIGTEKATVIKTYVQRAREGVQETLYLYFATPLVGTRIHRLHVPLDLNLLAFLCGQAEFHLPLFDETARSRIRVATR